MIIKAARVGEEILLRRFLRASCCRSTHHHFALDALPLVQTDAGKRLVRILLRHHQRYLTGAIDPDIRYCDYQNHVIHVKERYWGGAPRVAHSWYDRLQRYLRSDRYGDAAHAAGVLGHYFTDVLQPLHTEICDRERVLHRPLEWSVFAGYDAIYRLWRDDELRVVIQLSDRSQWLGEAMLHAARFANSKRRRLLANFDLQQATADPLAALGSGSRASLAELFGLAITGIARILERAADDAEAARRRPLPRLSLAVPTLLAGIDVPLKRATSWWAVRRERREVEALIDEYRSCGRLFEHLPAEVDIVHRVMEVYREERRWRGGRQPGPLAVKHGSGESEFRRAA